MKKIPNPFEWYPRDFWYWPDHDEKLLQVIHQVHDLDQVLPLIPNKRVCIQAGGACGVWPAYLSSMFSYVMTYEPHVDNYRILRKNIESADIKNCSHWMAAFGEKYDFGSIGIDSTEANNSGAHHIGYDGVGVVINHIDGVFRHGDADFICLDIEGFEHKALLGAKETIERCNPVIMIEEKPLPHLKPGEHLKARQYLESIGYKEVLKVNRDVVFIR